MICVMLSSYRFSLSVFHFLPRLTAACQKKCVPPKYNDSELAKGEAVCLDRCVAKYLDVHDRIGKKLTAMSETEQGGGAANKLPGTLPK